MNEPVSVDGELMNRQFNFRQLSNLRMIKYQTKYIHGRSQTLLKQLQSLNVSPCLGRFQGFWNYYILFKFIQSCKQLN